MSCTAAPRLVLRLRSGGEGRDHHDGSRLGGGRQRVPLTRKQDHDNLETDAPQAPGNTPPHVWTAAVAAHELDEQKWVEQQAEQAKSPLPWYRTYRLWHGVPRSQHVGLRFLVVQAVLFVLNLCSHHPLPTSDLLKYAARSARWYMATPPRVLYRALAWLAGRRRSGLGRSGSGDGLSAMAKLRSMPARMKKRRAAKRELNVTRAREHKALGMEAERVCDCVTAVKHFKLAYRLDPSDVESLLLRAKCMSDRVFEEEVFGTRKAYNIAQQAVHLSRRAVRRAPDMPFAHVALATNLGRLSMFSDNRERVKLAGGIRESALRALELDADNDLAKHVLGRWEMEMASLGPLVRSMAKMLYGDLGNGSMQGATAYFQAAAERAPEKLIHRVCLAKCHLKQGRKEMAKAELDLAMRLQVDDMNARCERRDGVELLKKHWNVTAPAPPPLRPAGAAAAAAAEQAHGRHPSLDLGRLAGEVEHLTSAARESLTKVKSIASELGNEVRTATVGSLHQLSDLVHQAEGHVVGQLKRQCSQLSVIAESTLERAVERTVGAGAAVSAAAASA